VTDPESDGTADEVALRVGFAVCVVLKETEGMLLELEEGVSDRVLDKDIIGV
jgi:hypothetical protein